MLRDGSPYLGDHLGMYPFCNSFFDWAYNRAMCKYKCGAGVTV